MITATTGQRVGRRGDDERRAVADQLQKAHPVWLVWWGSATRRYWAMPACGPIWPVLEHPRPDGLEAAMREVEVWHGIGPQEVQDVGARQPSTFPCGPASKPLMEV